MFNSNIILRIFLALNMVKKIIQLCYNQLIKIKNINWNPDLVFLQLQRL